MPKTLDTPTVSSLWLRIERWLTDNAPKLSLPDGASESSIAQTEEAMGMSLPKQVRESYERHDGSNRIWICKAGYLMPLFPPQNISKRASAMFTGVLESWASMRDMLDRGNFDDPGFVSKPKGPIRNDWWNTKWIPVTYNESGDHLCIDCAPAKGGKKGQVIDWWHEQGATHVVASNFIEWLGSVADEFEGGAFEFDAQLNKLIQSKSRKKKKN